MPLMVSSVARHSPRISEPRLNSTSSLSARTLPRSLAPPTTTERSRSDGVGSSRASSSPATRTGAPITRRGLGLELRPELVPVDEVRPDQRGHQRNDKGNRQSEQRRLHGVSLWARPGAMAARNGPPAAAEINAGAGPYIETIVAKSQHCLRRLRAGTPLPARGQLLEAAQHEGRPPFRIFGVVQPQIRQPAQQGRDRDLRLDAAPAGRRGRSECRRRTTADGHWAG